MIGVTESVRSLVMNNPLLYAGIRDRLLNLSQVAKYIQPQVCARTKKEVQPSAILMSLSRLQKELSKEPKEKQVQFQLSNMIIHSDLRVVTYPKTKTSHRTVNSVYNKIQSKGGFITITEGVNEITLISENKFGSTIDNLVTEKPISQHTDIASLGVKFDEKYLEIPGFLYLVLQQIYFQNINIIELASTATELIVYLKQSDVRLAFDTIYNRFVIRG